MSAITTSMPGLLSYLNAELRRRHGIGLSTDISDMSVEILFDDLLGLFWRNRFVMADESVICIDSRESGETLRKIAEQSVIGPTRNGVEQLPDTDGGVH